MHDLLKSIHKSLETENWYSALVTSLILPDICGKLQYPNKSSSERYISWFNSYLISDYEFCLTGEDCYALRCSYLHEGVDDISKQPKRNVLDFLMFTSTPEHCHNCKDKDGNVFILLNVSKFCSNICNGVEKWLQVVSGDSLVQDRLSKLLKIRHSIKGISSNATSIDFR